MECDHPKTLKATRPDLSLEAPLKPHRGTLPGGSMARQEGLQPTGRTAVAYVSVLMGGQRRGQWRDKGDTERAAQEGCAPRLRRLQGLGSGNCIKRSCVLADEKYQKEPQDKKREEKN